MKFRKVGTNPVTPNLATAIPRAIFANICANFFESAVISILTSAGSFLMLRRAGATTMIL